MDTAIKCIVELSGKNKLENERELEDAFQFVQSAANNEGLDSDEFDTLVEFLVKEKQSGKTCFEILKCLVPITLVSETAISKMLAWFFSGKLTKAVERYCCHWLIGIIYYELCDVDIIQSYYQSFLLQLFSNESLRSLLCKLLCLLTKECDAKPWTLSLLLKIQRKEGPKSHTNALLSILKSYRPALVPQRVLSASLQYDKGIFDESFLKAQIRRLDGCEDSGSVPGVSLTKSWRQCKVYESRSRHLPRLVPVCQDISFESSVVRTEASNMQRSVRDFNTLSELGVHLPRVSIPAQTMSLLANMAGYHVLAFSDLAVQHRFSICLYYTLRRVFLLRLEPYGATEMGYLLNQLAEMEEYIHQPIPAVTRFLTEYLLIWNGDDHSDEVLALIPWHHCSKSDLTDLVLPALRQTFRRSDTEMKCKLLRALAKLCMNIVAVKRRNAGDLAAPFLRQFAETDLTTVATVGVFSNQLIVEGLNYAPTKLDARILLTEALDFYETMQVVEMFGDLPFTVMVPPAVVYKCLMSPSRLCITTLCSLLNRYMVQTVERLALQGVVQDFAHEDMLLTTYVLDCYRCLFADTAFRPKDKTFLFDDKKMCELLNVFKELYGEIVPKIYNIENNIVFWDPNKNAANQNVQNVLAMLQDHHPEVLKLKALTEDRLSAH